MATAGSLDIQPIEIRDRLDLTEADISDKTLKGASYILKADAWATVVLNANSKTVATLEDYQAALLKASKINYVAIVVISRMPRDEVKEGPNTIKPVNAKSKEEMVKLYKEEIKDNLDLAGLKEYSLTGLITNSGGDSYHPTGNDTRQIDMITASEDSQKPFSVF